MAIDGKIYVTLPNQYQGTEAKMAVINTPEGVGAACGWDINAIDFTTVSSTVIIHQGLPPFIQSFFNVSIVYQQDNSVCEGNAVSFSINSNQTLTATEWNFGDGSPLVTNTETPSHTFPVLGEDHTYTINLHTEYLGDLGLTQSQDFTEDITIYAQPVLSAGATVATIEQCDDNNDGFFAFDLHTLKDAEILGLTNSSAANSFQVRYFPTEADLDADTNEITANPYTNITAYNETLWGRVENANHPDCYVKIPFDINIYDTPVFTPGAVVAPLQACDDNNDGFFAFDLHALKDAEIIGLAPAGTVAFQVRYFPTEADLDADTNEITTNPFTNTIAYNQTIWVRLENSTHIACYDKIALAIEVYDLPVLNAGATIANIEQCDDNNDGLFDFDLHALKDIEALGQVGAGATFQVRYFPTEADLDADTNEITANPYTNIIAYNETLWIRIENATHNACYTKIPFVINIYDTPTAGTPDDLADCDNNLDGDDTNGIITWDLSAANNTNLLNGQDVLVFEVVYYASNADFLTDTPITTPATYTNISNPQTITAVVRNRGNNTCLATTTFTLTVNPLPVLIAGVTLKQCDEDANPADGLTNFNLNEANTELVADVTGLTFTYFGDPALTIPLVPQDNYINLSNPQTIYALITNDVTTCSRAIALNLETSASQLDPNLMVNLNSCDDDGIEDGFHLFDLQDASATILTGLPIGQTYNVSYYATLADAQLEQNALPLTNYMSIAASQDVYVRVDNDTNNDCFGIGIHVNLLTNPLPQPILGDYFFCTNIGFVAIDATINDGNNYSYSWSSGEVTPSINATVVGDYTVTVTNVATSCVNTGVAHVTASSSPDTIAIITVDNSQNNSMEIIVTGIGDYEYSIDNGFTYFDTNYFEHLAPGFYDVVVRDKNGCGTITKMQALVSFPPYFTPNADGIHDYWKPLGILTPELVTIEIYDRYGKLIKTIRADSIGWDGMYNGFEVPSTDYWFHVKLPTPDGREFRSHFALKR
jgi:gliding motility-associated-like protein